MRKSRDYEPLKEEHADALDGADLPDSRSREKSTPLDEAEQALERDARAVGELLAQGRITPRDAVWRLRNFENARHSEMIASEQAQQRHGDKDGDNFVAQVLGKVDVGQSVEDETIDVADDDQRAELIDENAKKLIEQSKILDSQRDRLEALGRDPVKAALEQASRRPAKEAADAHIEDAGERFERAHDDAFNERDPMRSLARIAMAERNAYLERQEDIIRAADTEKDANRRQAFEDERDILEAEHIALTSRRISTNAAMIWGTENAYDAKVYGARADHFEERAEGLRHSYRQKYSNEQEFGTAQREETTRETSDAERQASYDVQVSTGRTVDVDPVGATAHDEATSAEGEKSDRALEREGNVSARPSPPAAPTSQTKPRDKSSGLSY